MMAKYFSNPLFYRQCIGDAARMLRPYLSPPISWVVQSGSGFGFVNQLPHSKAASIPYCLIPHFPQPTVLGHAGTMHIFHQHSQSVVVLEGRSHAYEGLDGWQLAFPLRVLAEFAPKRLLITNAMGGIRPDLAPGSLVAVQNYIGVLGQQPLQGIDETILGKRFVPMHQPFDEAVYLELERIMAALSLGHRLHRAVYVAAPGPSYESEAEIDAFEKWGADVVGMSLTVETITARACGIPIAALGLVTNFACGRALTALSHEEVVEMGQKMSPVILQLIDALVRRL